MEVGPPGGRWEMKWNRDPLQLSGAMTVPLTATSGPFFLQPHGLSRQDSLLPVPCSWGQTAPHRDKSVSLLSGPCCKVSPSRQKASASTQQLLPQPGAALWPVWAA